MRGEPDDEQLQPFDIMGSVCTPHVRIQAVHALIQTDVKIYTPSPRVDRDWPRRVFAHANPTRVHTSRARKYTRQARARTRCVRTYTSRARAHASRACAYTSCSCATVQLCNCAICIFQRLLLLDLCLLASSRPCAFASLHMIAKATEHTGHLRLHAVAVRSVQLAACWALSPWRACCRAFKRAVAR